MDKAQGRAVLKEIFQDCDVQMTGELSEMQLQEMYSDIRLGGVSLSQVKQYNDNAS